MTFDEPELINKLTKLTDTEYDQLPFGLVKLSNDGQVEFYNKYESELAGLQPDDVINRNFFTEIAPCTNNYMVAQKFLDESNLDEIINYIFTYKLNPTKVTLRLLRHDQYKSGFFLVKLDEG